MLHVPSPECARPCLHPRSKEQAGEAAITQQQDDPGQSLSFDELVALAQPSDLVLDAYSARGVLNAAPRSATALSSLKLAPDRFLQRYEVATQSGAGAAAACPGRVCVRVAPWPLGAKVASCGAACCLAARCCTVC